MINFVYPESHDHLGLLTDLAGLEGVNLIPIKRKNVNSTLLKKIRKIHLSSTLNRYIHMPWKNQWYDIKAFDLRDDKNAIVIFDGALKHFSQGQLNKLFSGKGTTGILVLINSMRASSATMSDIRDIIPGIKWDHVLTFDPVDAVDYHFEPLGCTYYSMQSEDSIRAQYPAGAESDIYFTGGIKGGRWEMIKSIFERLSDAGLRPDFKINVTGKARFEKHPYSDKIHYYEHEWFPYRQILGEMLNSNVILEILQNGQNGPSLRYYEAVCYNKKLLTNNPYTSQLPYFNPDYMKIIGSADEIDVDWIRERSDVQYHYKGDFSPVNLLKRIQQMLEKEV